MLVQNKDQRIQDKVKNCDDVMNPATRNFPSLLDAHCHPQKQVETDYGYKDYSRTLTCSHTCCALTHTFITQDHVPCKSGHAFLTFQLHFVLSVLLFSPSRKNQGLVENMWLRHHVVKDVSQGLGRYFVTVKVIF